MDAGRVTWRDSVIAIAALAFLVFLFTPGCVVSAETAKQMRGVATALETMPDAPVNEQTQKQMQGWAAWAAYLLRVSGEF